MKQYLRNWPLSSKLILIGLIPLFFILYLSAKYYEEKNQNLNAIHQYISRVNMVADVVALSTELQAEQKVSFDYALTHQGAADLLKQRELTDAALRKVRAVHDISTNRFEEYTFLYRLPIIRGLLDSSKLTPDGVTQYYSKAAYRLNTLAGYPFGQKKTIDKYYGNFRSQRILTEMLTDFNIVRCNIYNILVTRQYVKETLYGSKGLWEIYNSFGKELEVKAEPQMKAAYQQIQTHGTFSEVREYLERSFLSLNVDSTYSAAQWWQASEAAHDELAALQGDIWKAIKADLQTTEDSEYADRRITVVLLLLAIALVITVIVLTMASITRSLGALKFGAEKIASGQDMPPLAISSDDEIGSLAESITRINTTSREVAEAADAIGKGNFDIELKPRSEDDTLSNAVNRMRQGLQYLVKELQEREFRFRQLADLIPQIVWTADANGTPDYLNRQWYEYAGDVAIIEAIHPEDRPVIDQAWSNAIARCSDYSVEIRMQHQQSKEYRWFLVRAIPILDVEGHIIKWFGTSTDIHERKKLHEELQELVEKRTRELKRSNEDLQGFAHVTSHDLKEPLRKIQVFSSILLSDKENDLSEKSREYIDKIKSSSYRLMNMIESILNYSSFDAASQPFETVDLNKIVEAVIIDLEIAIQQKNAVVSYSNLPIIKGIPVFIHQLFYNLINNSLKFSRSEEIPAIRISAKELPEQQGGRQKYLEIKIADNGIGFDDEFSSKIFEVFTQLNAKNKYEGTGLGLALCKKIMERHEGQIYAEGEDNKGATFYLLFPMHLLVRPEPAQGKIASA